MTLKVNPSGLVWANPIAKACDFPSNSTSYSAIPSDVNDIAATVDFGDAKITAVIWKDNLAACQFHPEKSGKSGEILLSRWVDWLKKRN